MPKLKSRKLLNPVWPILFGAFGAIMARDILSNGFGLGEWETIAVVLGVALVLLLAVRAAAHLRGRGQREEQDA